MTPDEIKALRKKLGLTQQEFSNVLGVVVVTVARWESGYFKPAKFFLRELKELRDDTESYIRRRQKS